MSFKLSVDKLVQCDKVLQRLETIYRDQGTMSHVSSNGNTDRTGEKLDETELLRMFIDTLRKTIDNYPVLNR